jgi:ParB family chromosome partitioning protein
MAKKVVRPEAGKAVKRDSLSAGIRAVFNTDNLSEAIAQDPEAVVKELSNHFLMVPLEQIERNRDQPRAHFSEKELQELAESIRVHGLIQPITVRYLEPKRYQIISGERRFRASQIVGLSEIPAYIRTANDSELLEMALLENIQRQDLNPIEIATSYARLIEEFKLTQEQLSERMGKIDRTTIANYIRLMKLEEPIQSALKSNTISFGHGRILAGVDVYTTRMFLFNETVLKGLSVRGLDELRKSLALPKEKKTESKTDLPEAYLNVEQQFKAFFGIKKVQLKVNAEGKGQIIIPFANTKALNELLDRLEEQG